MYGVSVLAAPTEAALDELARTVLVRYDVLVLMRAGTIRSAGLELRPTVALTTRSCFPTWIGTSFLWPGARMRCAGS